MCANSFQLIFTFFCRLQENEENAEVTQPNGSLNDIDATQSGIDTTMAETETEYDATTDFTDAESQDDGEQLITAQRALNFDDQTQSDDAEKSLNSMESKRSAIKRMQRELRQSLATDVAPVIDEVSETVLSSFQSID